MKQFNFDDKEIDVIREALHRMQLVSYANFRDNDSNSAVELFILIGSLLSKLS